MLHAILGNKAGRIEVDGKSISVREVYKEREDMITAAVISRIPYLSPDARASLFKLCLPTSSKDYSEVLQVEFWPRLASIHQNQVEPDVIIKFDWGVLLIEAKRPSDGQQSTCQWFKEIASVSTDDDYKGEIVFLALGGKSVNNKVLLQELDAKLEYESYEISERHELSWTSLAGAITRLLDNDDILSSDTAILSDINSALELYGIFGRPSLRTLPKFDLSQRDSLAWLMPWQADDYWQDLVQVKRINAKRISEWLA
ncbi:hypothetical protein [Endozoicomonas ascidiicola]|uniref:hypothetical protein n=1 Tax=Endozoicomonas ascidiicola TaxID=1698521 RepID=UPI0008319AFC|nr:hypothetical protein [Endozoicomonas ascidiicola]